MAIETYPTPEDVLNTILRSMKLDAQRRGLTSFNVLPGSDRYIMAKAFASRVAVAIANGQVARDNYSPLTATGDNLRAIAAMHGITERPASHAVGYVTIAATATVPIPAQFVCTAPSGETYATTTAFTGGSGSQVQIMAQNGGESTNLAAGTKVTWNSASIAALNPVATVASGGIDGGADGDDDETIRRRLLDKLAAPGVGGNVAQVMAWAEEATAAVEAAYVYAAVRGPASYDVAVTAAGGDRSLSSTVTGHVSSYVIGQMPGHANVNVTSVLAQEVDVVFATTLALPASAGGAGNGWRDPTPWPNASSGNVTVTAYTSATGVVTTSASALNGLAIGTRIGIWNPTGGESADGIMREYTVDSVTLSGGFYRITVQGGFGFDPTGAYVSTGAVNLSAYAETAKAQVAALGPGEKTANSDILPRGRRQPPPDTGAETDLNTRVLTAIQSAHPEIRSLEYASRYDTGTTNTRTAPSIPASTASAPRILVLKHLAFRRA